MLKIFTFCVDIGRHSKQQLISTFNLLLMSLHRYVKAYQIICFRNFNFDIDTKYNVIFREYYNKQTLYSDKLIGLLYNKIFIYKDLFDEFSQDYTWCDLDTIITTDISYINDMSNCFIQIGGTGIRPVQLIRDHPEIYVPRNKYIQGNFWKLNVSLYNEIMSTMEILINGKLIPILDLQDLFSYHIIYQNNYENINLLGNTTYSHAIYGLIVWDTTSNAHASLDGLTNIYYDKDILRTRLIPDKEIHILSFTFYSLHRLITNQYFSKLFLYKEIFFKNEAMNILIPFDNHLRHRYYTMFETRDNCEPNFRLLIRWLYTNGILDKHKNIIDLGAWIGDNSIPWAKVINGYVYAIDPSIDNINYIKELMYLNVIKNVIPMLNVISDKEETVYSSGDIRHTEFSSNKGTNMFKTTSLDNLYSSLKIENIEFIHLDVEGFEFKVLCGSRKIINDSRPVVVWKNHLDTDDVSGTVSFFSSYNYESYMINEFFPHCRRTCRNFISFPKEKGIIIEDINTHFTETSNKSISMMPFLISV